LIDRHDECKRDEYKINDWNLAEAWMKWQINK